MHTFGEFCAISPKPIFSLCIAAHGRFAKAEEVALRHLQSEICYYYGTTIPFLHMFLLLSRLGAPGISLRSKICLTLLKIGEFICNFLNKYVLP